MFWGAKIFLIIFKKYCSDCTKKLHEMTLNFFIFFILGKKIMIFKLELSPQNFHYDVLNTLYSDLKQFGHYKCPFLAMFSKLSLHKIHI